MVRYGVHFMTRETDDSFVGETGVRSYYLVFLDRRNRSVSEVSND